MSGDIIRDYRGVMADCSDSDGCCGQNGDSDEETQILDLSSVKIDRDSHSALVSPALSMTSSSSIQLTLNSSTGSGGSRSPGSPEGESDAEFCSGIRPGGLTSCDLDGNESAKKLYRCRQCKYVTDRKNNLKRHVITMHEQCAKVLECCSKVFANKAALREHVVSCHKNGYDCVVCGRNFCRKALLKRHITVHSGQKDYVCSVCGYATSHKSNLDRHKRRHLPKELRYDFYKQPVSSASWDSPKSSSSIAHHNPLSALSARNPGIVTPTPVYGGRLPLPPLLYHRHLYSAAARDRLPAPYAGLHAFVPQLGTGGLSTTLPAAPPPPAPPPPLPLLPPVLPPSAHMWPTTQDFINYGLATASSRSRKRRVTDRLFFKKRLLHTYNGLSSPGNTSPDPAPHDRKPRATPEPGDIKHSEVDPRNKNSPKSAHDRLAYNGDPRMASSSEEHQRLFPRGLQAEMCYLGGPGELGGGGGGGGGGHRRPGLTPSPPGLIPLKKRLVPSLHTCQVCGLVYGDQLRLNRHYERDHSQETLQAPQRPLTLLVRTRAPTYRFI